MFPSWLSLLLQRSACRKTSCAFCRCSLCYSFGFCVRVTWVSFDISCLDRVLQIPSCYIFKQTFNRPNLRYTVQSKPKDCIKQIAAEIRCWLPFWCWIAKVTHVDVFGLKKLWWLIFCTQRCRNHAFTWFLKLGARTGKMSAVLCIAFPRRIATIWLKL
jgi:hypothetical protein